MESIMETPPDGSGAPSLVCRWWRAWS